MNKEIEVLNILRDNHIQFTKEKYVKLDKEKLQNIIKRKLARWDILEQALKRNKPMKVEIGTSYNFEYHICPNCKNELNGYYKHVNKFCKKCGQKLDWSDDETEKEKENE